MLNLYYLSLEYVYKHFEAFKLKTKVPAHTVTQKIKEQNKNICV